MMDRVTRAAGLAMSLRMERSAVLAANIANKDTPNYTPLELNFSDALSDVLNGKTEVEGMRQPDQGLGVVGEPGSQRGEVVFDPGRVPGEDGNSVDLDREINRQVDNAINYQSLAKIIKKKQGFMNYAVSNRGG
jgi:flagellar basal-body rod protein FlgB